MPPETTRTTLADRSPVVGETLKLSGQAWEVTDHSSYRRDDGIQVEEWCCETGDTEAYLLREPGEDGSPRWFFTRWIHAGQVSLQGSRPIPDWDSRLPDPEPPKALVTGGDIYNYADTADGTYEEEPGEVQRKITWEFWNEGKTRNVAIEFWGDGGHDCYRGSYVEGRTVEIVPPPLTAGLPLPSSMPLLAMLVAVVSYLVTMLALAWPFDQGFALALLAASAAVLAAAPVSVPSKQLSLLAIAAPALVFWRWAPLSGLAGAAALLGAPLALAAARRFEPREGLTWLCAAAGLLPAGIWGVYHYFHFAPAPHTISQLALALAPAALGAVMGLVAGLTLGAGEQAVENV